MNKVWHLSNDSWYNKDITSTFKSLRNEIYTVELDLKTAEIYLKEFGKRFVFNYKIYDLQNDFIDRFLKTYNRTQGNLGVLFNGIKGTSKTVTAKIIANELNLPVLLVTKNLPGLDNFLANIEQDVVIFIDEFEKVFKGSISEDDWNRKEGTNDPTLLSLMDGVYNTKHRKIFLLTSNSASINDSMLNRTGRIRYLKNFGDLDINQIIYVIDDLLEYPKYKEDVIKFLKPLKIITIDILKSIISEINIHNESPFECCKDFNVQHKDVKYNVIRIDIEPNEVLHENINESTLIRMLDQNYDWHTAGFSLGSIYYKNVSKPDYHRLEFTVSHNNVEIKIKLVKVELKHTIFKEIM